MLNVFQNDISQAKTEFFDIQIEQGRGEFAGVEGTVHVLDFFIFQVRIYQVLVFFVARKVAFYLFVDISDDFALSDLSFYLPVLRDYGNQTNIVFSLLNSQPIYFFYLF